MGTSVFVSHVASESDVAVWIEKEMGGLFGGKVSFFVSSDGEQIVGGDKWLEKILDGLHDSSIALVLCSQESVYRPWINFEAGGAWMAGKRVIPLCHGGMEPGKLPQPLATLQAYSLYDPEDLRRLIALFAKAADVEPPQYDVDSLVRTLPPRAQVSTNAKSFVPSETRQSHTGRDALSAPVQRVDRSDYVFEKRTGIHRHNVTKEAVCTNCLLEGRVSPLAESPEGWRCHFNRCREFYSNPDFNPPQPEDYDPMTHGRI